MVAGSSERDKVVLQRWLKNTAHPLNLCSALNLDFKLSRTFSNLWMQKSFQCETSTWLFEETCRSCSESSVSGRISGNLFNLAHFFVNLLGPCTKFSMKIGNASAHYSAKLQTFMLVLQIYSFQIFQIFCRRLGRLIMHCSFYN